MTPLIIAIDYDFSRLIAASKLSNTKMSPLGKGATEMIPSLFFWINVDWTLRLNGRLSLRKVICDFSLTASARKDDVGGNQLTRSFIHA